MSVEVLIRNASSTIGEGPHWDDVTQTLLFVDLTAGDVMRWHYDTDRVDKMHIGPHTSFIIPCKNGGYVGSCLKSIIHYNWGDLKIATLTGVSTENESRLNDGKCDALGRLWTGTMPTAIQNMPFGEQQLYSYSPAEALKSHKDGISLSNGIAWSGDNSTMFYADTIPRIVYAFHYNLQNGTISNEREVINLNDVGPPTDVGYPDGMTIDTEDKLWVACFSGGRVIRVDPDTGLVLRTITFPVSRIASCCFGGPNLDELFVTSARFKYSANEPEEELAGSVFRVKDLGVKGRRANLFDNYVLKNSNL